MELLWYFYRHVINILLTCYNFYEALSCLSNVTYWTIMFVRRHELSMTSSDTIRLFPFAVIATRSFYHSTRIYLGQRNTPLACTRFLIRIIYYDNVCIMCCLCRSLSRHERRLLARNMSSRLSSNHSRKTVHHYYPNKRVLFPRGRLTMPSFNRHLIRVIE